MAAFHRRVVVGGQERIIKAINCTQSLTAHSGFPTIPNDSFPGKSKSRVMAFY